MREVLALFSGDGPSEAGDTGATVVVFRTGRGLDSPSPTCDEEGRHGLAVQLRLPDEQVPWPPEVTSTVYGVVQKSLTNIARHAAHTHSATVSVTQEQEENKVEITDDAMPGPSRHRHGGGFGLIGMRERVEALAGMLRIGPEHGVGWEVVATLPVPAGDTR